VCYSIYAWRSCRTSLNAAAFYVLQRQCVSNSQSALGVDREKLVTIPEQESSQGCVRAISLLLRDSVNMDATYALAEKRRALVVEVRIRRNNTKQSITLI
jgi:hypothetical protein